MAKRRSVVVVILAAMLGCDRGNSVPTSATGCLRDLDCKGDRVCVSGRCENPAPAPTAPVVPDPVAEPPPVAAQASAARPSGASCALDRDCKDDQLCVNGRCVSPKTAQRGSHRMPGMDGSCRRAAQVDHDPGVPPHFYIYDVNAAIDPLTRAALDAGCWPVTHILPEDEKRIPSWASGWCCP